MLKQIFKDNPELLEAPEVKELIRFAEGRYHKVYKRIQALEDLEFFVLQKCMYSDIIVKGGDDCDKVVKSILDYIEEH